MRMRPRTRRGMSCGPWLRVLCQRCARACLRWLRGAGCVPMLTDFAVEVLPAFFRKEDARAFELHASPGAGNGLRQPVRPSDVEIDVVGAPRDQRRRLQPPQSVLDRERVTAIECADETCQVARTLRRGEERPQVRLDG